MSHDSSNALYTTTVPTYQVGLYCARILFRFWPPVVPGSTNFPAASAPEAYGETALWACGLRYEGREHQAEPPATCTWAKGWVWVLLGADRAQNSSCIPGEDIHGTQPQQLPAEPHRDGPGGGGHGEGKCAMGPAASRTHRDVQANTTCGS